MPFSVSMLKIDGVEVDRAPRRSGSRASRSRPPWAMLRRSRPERGRVAGHLEPDVEALGHAELALDVGEVALAWVDGERRAHPPRELEPVRVEVGDDDVARARVPHDRGRHAADRAGTGDEHVLAEDRERERGVHGVAERVEDRGDVVVDARPVVPDVRHRQRDVLGERAGPLDAEADRVGAQVAPAGHAVAAAAADDVPLAADEVAGREVADVRADLDDLADELVADHERHRDRLLRPRVPAVDVEVGAADARRADPDQDVVDPDLGLGDVLEPEPRLGLALDERLHGGESYAAQVRWK